MITLRLTCLVLSAFIIPHAAYAQQQQQQHGDAFDAATTLSQKITPIRTLDDLQNFIRPPPTVHHPLGRKKEDDDNATVIKSTTTTTSDDNDDVNQEKAEAPSEALFILFDTWASEPEPASITDAKENVAITSLIRRTFQSFADGGYQQQHQNDDDEFLLRFGIIETGTGTDGVETATAGVFGAEEVIAKEMGIKPKQFMLDYAKGPAVVCLRCGGVEGRVETWVVPSAASDSDSKSEAEGEGGQKNVDLEVLVDLERWMREMTRPVIGVLRKGNLERVREVCLSWLLCLPCLISFLLSRCLLRLSFPLGY